MPSQPYAPLSEDELVEIDSFLLSDVCDGAALSIDEVHGFLTALIVSAEPVAQEEWLAAVWGEPQFADEAQKQRMTGLLLRLYAEIAATLEAGRSFEPLVVEVEEDGEVAEAHEGWCFGFMLGVAQHQALWDRLVGDEKTLVEPMAQLALLNSEEEPTMSEEEYASWVELIPGSVMGLYQFWRSAMGRRLAAMQPDRTDS